MSKLNLAMYWAGSCGGCEIAVLELHSKLLELLAKVNIVFWPCVMDFKLADVKALDDQSIDLCLFNGTIETTENLAVARLLRQKSKLLVAFGACASLGGIPGLRNLHGRLAVLNRSFRTTESTDRTSTCLPRASVEHPSGAVTVLPTLFKKARALDQVIETDFAVPGCPPEANTVWQAIAAILKGQLPNKGANLGAGEHSVCDECSLARRGTKIKSFVRPHEIIPKPDVCLLEQGMVCMGPATASGCQARCTEVLMPCRGCYGPAGDAIDQGAKMIAYLGSLVDGQKEDVIKALIDEIADPTGTFYRFSLPKSLLGRSR